MPEHRPARGYDLDCYPRVDSIDIVVSMDFEGSANFELCQTCEGSGSICQSPFALDGSVEPQTRTFSYFEETRCTYTTEAIFEGFEHCSWNEVLSCLNLETAIPTLAPTTYPTTPCPDEDFEIACYPSTEGVNVEFSSHFSFPETSVFKLVRGINARAFPPLTSRHLTPSFMVLPFHF